MKKLEITSISSRGQVVIPQEIRERMHLENGEKFVVVGERDTIILKKLEVPSFKGFGELLKKTRMLVKQKRIQQRNVNEAIKEVRHR